MGVKMYTVNSLSEGVNVAPPQWKSVSAQCPHTNSNR